MAKYREIDLCMECSAKKLSNISEVFYQAQKLVLYPLHPLYSVTTKMLTPAAEKAMTRVFNLSDLDGDEHIDENELSELQRKAFNAPLPGQALEDLRSLVRNYDGDSFREWKLDTDEWLSDNEASGLTKDGFLILLKALIERGRQDTVWILLRTFGYDDGLNIGRETGPFFLPNSLNLRPEDCTELSLEARHFLTVMFNKCDLDNDGFLNGNEQRLFFRSVPVPSWHRSDLQWQVQTSNADINLVGLLSWYDYKAFFEPRSVLSDLAYLGFPILTETPLENALDIRQRRQPSSEVQATKNRYRVTGNPLGKRRVFLVKVLGARYSGKTTFMQGLIGHDLEYCENHMRTKYRIGSDI